MVNSSCFINEAVCNPTSEHSLLSEYQLRDFGIKVNSIARGYRRDQNLITDGQKILCGVKNWLIYFKCQACTDEELDKLKPIVLSQREVPWNPRAEEHSSAINNDFYKKVIAAAEADAQAKMEEDQVLMTVQQADHDCEVKTTKIFNCLMELDEKVRQEVTSDFPSSRNNSSTQE